MQDPSTIIVLLALGAGALIGYFEYHKRRKRIINNGIEVDGIVFSFDNEPKITIGTSNPNIPIPMIRFVTKDGLWMTEKGDWGSTSLEEGDKVIVIYNADNPKEFIYRTSSKDWLGQIMGYVLLLAGIICLAIGLLLAYQYLTNNA